MDTAQCSDVEVSKATYVGLSTNRLLQLADDLQTQDADLDKHKQMILGLEEKQRNAVWQLEQENLKLDNEIMTLKLRDKTFQKEHTCLRNAVTIVKFKVEKIKESISMVKASELKDLENFEKAVDETSVKYRSSPALFDRRNLTLRLEKEKDHKALLSSSLEEVKQKFAAFNNKNGLRERKDESEDLLDCVLPGSELFSLVEMEKNLREVISSMKETSEIEGDNEARLQDLKMKIKSADAKLEDLRHKSAKEPQL